MATTMYSSDDEETATGFEMDHKEVINDLVSQLGSDYAEYIKVDYANRKQTLDDTIDEMLTRLDEFCGMIDMVRSDDALCLSKTLPGVYAKSQELEHLYRRIDKLEAFIGIVQSNLEAMDNKITEAECLLGGSSVKKLLNNLQKPLLFSRKPAANIATGAKKRIKYEPPEIFRASDYFKAPTSIKEDAEVNAQNNQETNGNESSSSTSTSRSNELAKSAD